MMGNRTKEVDEKIASFRKKYYLNLFLRGTILSLTLLLAYFLMASLIEYNLWLSKGIRLSLFILFFGTMGYWLITAASRTGEVSVVSPFRYARLIFSIVIGIAAFAEYPDRLTLIGAAVIITSGLYAFARERGLSRAAAAR